MNRCIFVRKQYIFKILLTSSLSSANFHTSVHNRMLFQVDDVGHSVSASENMLVSRQPTFVYRSKASKVSLLWHRKTSLLKFKFKLSFIVIPLHVGTYSGTKCRASQDHGAT